MCVRRRAPGWLLASTLVSAGIAPLWAQSAGQAPTETVVVTGTRIPGPAPAGVRLLDSEVLAERNAATAADVLARVPGLYSSAPDGRAGIGSIFWRGAEPNFTTVLIDGVQMNDPTNSRGGSFDLSSLNVDDIARVELAGGALSSVYGSDALGGVINFITREPGERLQGALGGEIGSGAYARASASLSGPVATGGGYSAAVSHAEADGAGDQTGHRADAVSGRLELVPGAFSRLALSLRHSRTTARGFPDASGGPVYAVLREPERRAADDSTLGLDWRVSRFDRVELAVAASYLAHDEQQESPGIAPGMLDGLPASVIANEFTRSNVAVQARLSPSERLESIVGLNFRRERGDSAGEIQFAPGTAVPSDYRIVRDVMAGYLEMAFRPAARVTTTVALRRDHADTWGSENSGRLGIAYEPDAALKRLYLNWGQGFKLPSLFALAHPLVGNPALGPEFARSLELGAEFAPGAQWTVEARAFLQRFRDVIDFDFDTFRSVNRGRVNSDGIELGSSFEGTRGWTVRAHATALEVDLLDGGPPLTQRPERLAGMDAYWPVGAQVGLFAAWRYVGSRYDSSIPTGAQRLPAYEQTDLGLDWRPARGPRWRVSLDNVFDDRYQTAVGFPVIGRSVRLALSQDLTGS